jgi:hypothetical protein
MCELPSKRTLKIRGDLEGELGEIVGFAIDPHQYTHTTVHILKFKYFNFIKTNEIGRGVRSKWYGLTSADNRTPLY